MEAGTSSCLAISIDLIVNHALLLSNAPLDLIQVIIVVLIWRALFGVAFLVVVIVIMCLKKCCRGQIHLFLQLARLLIL